MLKFCLQTAIESLELDINMKYRKICELVNVNHASDIAPETLEGIYNDMRNGMFHVWTGASDKTIFSSPLMNHKYRVVHDFYHALFNCETTPEGELKLWQCLVKNNLLPLSIAAALVLHVEHVGQVQRFKDTGKFPEDQRQFMLDVLRAANLDIMNIPWDVDKKPVTCLSSRDSFVAPEPVYIGR